ncbi:Crp/Fnr family transcriptional regulator [Nocardiopsis sp. RSe5-2]|uniref:Crp/Fnr family transcriptional regulator n=1 Tax=Nocardiopsis endophytica TaxID=3018445 RepID=A0ABT4UDX4_9ACTN|nr:Crp/Fnr family transcriptional regulator [Nocardiopsis endophytica]MDA2815123.1 Crp/Fnr family transcriptional regulator [Nocardiopsis endophytica]
MPQTTPPPRTPPTPPPSQHLPQPPPRGRPSARVDDPAALRLRLCASPLLSGLPPEVADDFLASARLRGFGAGDRLYTEGEPGDCVYLLVSGKVKMTHRGPGGSEIPHAMAGPGELIGELTVLTGGGRKATATAVCATVAASPEPGGLEGWLERHPCAAFRMMELLIGRVRRMNALMDVQLGADVPTRVARSLAEQAARFGRPTPEGLRFRLDLRQEELARHVCASRERVNQVLVDLSRRGWIRRDGPDLVVLDPEALNRRGRVR